MLVNDVENILRLFENKSRFLKIEKENIIWIYDSYIHEIFPFDKNLIETKLTQDLQLSLIKQPLLEITPFFLQLARINTCNKDSFVIEPENDEANIMLNTSHRCNLDCKYCYRDKQNVGTNNIENISKSIDFVLKKYKPNASGYIFTYSMTSESSVDIEILEQVLERYPQFEQRMFRKEDIKYDKAFEFYKLLVRDFNLQFEITESIEATVNNILNILNSMIENRNLFDFLNMTEDVFNENDIQDVIHRKEISRWRLLRINSLILEKKYRYFIFNRNIPWLTFNFFTNGTCASKRFLNFLRKINVRKLDISIDGPEDVHNRNRMYRNNIGSYKDVIKNLQIFLKEGYEINCSSVITPEFPNPLEIALHIKELGVKTLSMVPVRYGSVNSFSEDNIFELMEGYEKLYKRIESDLLNNNFGLISLLKDDMCLAPVISILQKTKRIQRCTIDNQIVIDIDGNIYNCLYTCAEKMDCIGNIQDGILTTIDKKSLLVTSRIPCDSCWARYLCSGTCYYTAKKETTSYRNSNSIECILQKFICEQALKLIIFLRENEINSDYIMNNVI